MAKKAKKMVVKKKAAKSNGRQQKSEIKFGVRQLAKHMGVEDATVRLRLRDAGVKKSGKSYDFESDAGVKKVAVKLGHKAKAKPASSPAVTAG